MKSKTLYRGAHVWQQGQVDILITGNTIEAIGQNLNIDEHTIIKDVRGRYIYPGLINTHHHLTQSLAKAMPAGISLNLNQWLGAVPYALWQKISPEILYNSALVGFYELIRSGCTSCADHFYIYHREFNQELEDALYQAADDVGIRFVHCRGGATHIGSHKGARETNIVPESLELFLQRLDDTRTRQHKASSDSMRRLVAAPTSIVHTSPPEHLREISAYCRSHSLHMHSHLLEVEFDDQASREIYDMPAIDFAASCDWLGPDVWFAHLVHTDQHAINLLSETRTGIAHCPTSNCRLGSGFANVPKMDKQNMRISLGVDGSASSESGSMFNELLLTWLIHRAHSGPEATDITEVINWASKGGADILGYEKLGRLAPGMLADFFILNLDQPRFWGLWQPEWAPVVCGEPLEVETSVINGKTVFDSGRLLGVDLFAAKQSVLEAVRVLMT